MRRILCALVVAALVAACGADEPVAMATPTPEPTVEPTPEPPEETPEPAPEPVRAPLTGVDVEQPEDLDRPVLAVKIDNAPQARPQQGLELADIVFVELVEGGTTRFVALYHSTDPGVVGPVRSGREVDASLLPAYSPVFGISGAAPPVYGDFRAAGLTVFEEGQAGGAFFRERSRRAPHNVYATAQRLWEAGDALPRPQEPVWAFAAEVPAGGDPAAAVALSYPRNPIRWTWDPQGTSWLREQDGAPQLAAGVLGIGAEQQAEAEPPEPQQVDATNVVVMRVVVTQGDRVDSNGNPTAAVQVVGEGDVLVLRDGHVFPARWRKQSPSAPIELLTPQGDPFPLAPGRTWVELLPTTAPLETTAPEPPAGSAAAQGPAA